MIIVGGMGNIWGALVGGLALVYVDKTLLPYLSQRSQQIGEAIGCQDLANYNLASLNFLIFGLILVFMMRVRPEGFLPSRQRAAELHHAPPTEAIGAAALLEPDKPYEDEVTIGLDSEVVDDADASNEDGAPRAGGRS
jgi:branched-chain amino acid transport system permease protein